MFVFFKFVYLSLYEKKDQRTIRSFIQLADYIDSKY